MASNFSWNCPYCNQIATIKSDNFNNDIHYFSMGNKLGQLGLLSSVIVCPNSKCHEFTINSELYKAKWADGSLEIFGDPLLSWKLKPQSSAKPFPSYIPTVILQDYTEACLIRDLSPKASATLSRRCLQGMIRDFWGVSKSRLIDEINALEGKVDSTTWEAIDAVRNIGNVGAHMEKDINIVIDVEPSEAEMLIGLIEVLLEEWYVRRYERDAHMQKVIAAAKSKKVSKSSIN